MMDMQELPRQHASRYRVDHGQKTSRRGKGSKQDTIFRLERSATMLFSRHGFDGTSLRDIAAHADVTLSTIDRHFGSKKDLFNQMQRRVWKEINVERDALLSDPTSLDENGQPTLDSILYALIYPIVARAMGDECRVGKVRFLRELATMWVHHDNSCCPRHINVAAERWVCALMRTCPGLSRSRAVWAYSFLVGTIFSGHLLDRWFDDLMPADNVPSATEVTSMLITFCSAGILAIGDKTLRLDRGMPVAHALERW